MPAAIGGTWGWHGSWCGHGCRIRVGHHTKIASALGVPASGQRLRCCLIIVRKLHQIH